jgi:glycosyltransferase involved in cell wall biosynthesis
MSNELDFILQSAKKHDKHKILTFVTHERFEPNLCQTGFDFYALTGKDIRNWNIDCSPIPNNYHILGQQIPNWLTFDVIISQNPFAHLQHVQPIKQHTGRPVIAIYHTMPPPGWTKQHYYQHERFLNIADYHVFITEFSLCCWGFNPNADNVKVIHHGLDTNLFCADENKVRDNVSLSVVNQWKERDWACGYSLWTQSIQGIPVRVVGENPGLSNRAKDIYELVDILQRSSVFCNTSLNSPVPMSFLEGMSCECGIVSAATCMIPDIIKDGINGFLVSPKKPEKINEKLRLLINEPELARSLGKAARQTILTDFNMENFIREWKNTINYVIQQYS